KAAAAVAEGSAPYFLRQARPGSSKAQHELGWQPTSLGEGPARRSARWVCWTRGYRRLMPAGDTEERTLVDPVDVAAMDLPSGSLGGPVRDAIERTAGALGVEL